MRTTFRVSGPRAISRSPPGAQAKSKITSLLKVGDLNGRPAVERLAPEIAHAVSDEGIGEPAPIGSPTQEAGLEINVPSHNVGLAAGQRQHRKMPGGVGREV